MHVRFWDTTVLCSVSDLRAQSCQCRIAERFTDLWGADLTAIEQVAAWPDRDLAPESSATSI
ncbi:MULTISPECIES: hypothetical protein [Sinorhizobium]|uniref:hypothetical protein n=1 Tax=Sinorhizobium TaxID=28105 RepID=UPI0004B6294D|nr:MULTISPECIES: hypothetical protein [Sinorhizobium]ASY56585.1 hypothetical protein SS05631_c16520 [Sinorhizobium sp. CCBAU 05631]AWM25066.1 hypothetical protein AOX55_00001812 [Sinorhizobium fredii CCBAU 25509]